MKRYAYAKVNLFLNVKNKREDGYHNLEMINISIGLADELDFELTDGEIKINTSTPLLNAKNNLSYKVATFLKKTYKVDKGVSIYIQKNIPLGGGLGGGSSDAACTIRALNDLWSLGLDEDKMYEISKRFGSDTPFCLYTNPAICTGRGEIIEPIDVDISDFEISVFTPKANISTGDVFNKLQKYETYSLEEAKKHLISRNYDEFVKGLHNSLTKLVFDLYPEVKAQYDFLADLYGEEGLFVTGSGATIIKISRKGEFKPKKHAHN